MNLNKLWKIDEIEIIEKFRRKCVRCRKDFDTLHEIEPKSKLPKTWKKEGNRIPLCKSCHAWAHRVGCQNSQKILEQLRDRRLDEYSGR